MRKLSLFVLFIVLSLQVAPGQILNSPGQPEDEGKFAASTKQVNQFFRRFNAEESKDGYTRYQPGDNQYRDRELREDYISILFDNETSDVTNNLKRDFINEVNSKNYPQYLQFHGADWFAEVSTVFIYKGKRENITLFMKLQPEGLGYEWVIDKVSFDSLKKFFDKQSGKDKSFLHPLSHELGFMNLRKALQDDKKPESYTPKDYEPDYLTLFLYEIKNGNIKFQTVNGVKFHFFQIKKWYFELSQFNRPGYNTGWLISNLVRFENDDEKEVILNYIYDQK